MTGRQKFKHGLYMFLFDLRGLPGKIRRKIWNKRIKLWWNKLFIRTNEFHSSLSMDPLALMEMTEKERDIYLADLGERRRLAHNRDIAREDAE